MVGGIGQNQRAAGRGAIDRQPDPRGREDLTTEDMVDCRTSAELDGTRTGKHQRCSQCLRRSTRDFKGAAFELNQLSDRATRSHVDPQRGTAAHGSQVGPAISCCGEGRAKGCVVGDLQRSIKDGDPSLESVGPAQGDGAAAALDNITRTGDDRADGLRIRTIDRQGAVVQDGSTAHHAGGSTIAQLKVAVANGRSTRSSHRIGNDGAPTASRGDNGIGSSHIGEDQIPQQILLVNDQFIARAR